MSSRAELKQWTQACNAFDGNDYGGALSLFINLAENAKMHFNIGSMFTTMNDHKRAITAFSRAVARDSYFAAGYFQRGVSMFLLGNLEAAKDDFDSAYQNLRGNSIINYQQLGLQFRLYSCEVLFNRGICQLYLGQIDSGLTDLYHAQKAKETKEHDIIDQAVRDRGKGYSVYSIPPGLLFRPLKVRINQLKKGIDMFQEELTQRKDPILPHQPTEEPLPLANGEPIPIQSLSSSSSSSSIQSPISPITPTAYHHYTSISQPSTDSNGGAGMQHWGESHRPSSNTRQAYSAYLNGKLKVKCHYTDVRVLLASTDVNYQELKSIIADKFKISSQNMQLAYKDEELQQVFIIDDDDLNMARQINRVRHRNGQSDREKLELWIQYC
ncbi:hypothetical protein MBANPS3_002980 [Mucor bainieri]